MAELRSLSVRPLTANRIAQAYPLAQLSFRNCAQAAWDAYARRHLVEESGPAAASGILVADDAKGFIVGLLVYQISDRSGEGRRFQAKTVVVTEPFASGRLDVASMLIDAEEENARERCCSSAEVFLPTERGPRESIWWAGLLAERGYSPAGTHFVKLLKNIPQLQSVSIC